MTSRFLLAILLLAAPLQADDANRTNTTLDLISSGTTTLAAGASLLRTRQLDLSEVQGLDWYMTSPSAISVTFEIRSSNSSSGPFDYGTSINNTNTTNSFSTADGTNATDLRLVPAKWHEFKLINNGAATVTLRRVTLFTY